MRPKSAHCEAATELKAASGYFKQLPRPAADAFKDDESVFGSRPLGTFLPARSRLVFNRFLVGLNGAGELYYFFRSIDGIACGGTKYFYSVAFRLFELYEE